MLNPSFLNENSYFMMIIVIIDIIARCHVYFVILSIAD